MARYENLYMNPLNEEYYENMRKIAEGELSDQDEAKFAKALGIDSTTTGAEFIPELWTAKIVWQLYEESWARQLFEVRPLSTTKQNIPKFSTKLVEASGTSSPIDAIPSELTSTTAIEKATMTTTEVELEIKTLAIRLQIHNKWKSYNVEPNIEAKLRTEFVNALREAEEDMIINCDTETSSASNINYTYDSSSHPHGVNSATGDNEHMLLFAGLRHEASATAVTNSGSAWTAAKMAEAFKNLGIFARKGLNNLVYLVSPDLHGLMITWDELETMEKVGTKAGILTGQIGQIYGVRVVVTDKMPNTARSTLTNSSGVRAASANSYTEWLLMYTPALIIGVSSKPERVFNLKKKDWPEYDRFDLIVVEDFGFIITETGAICRGYYGTA